MHMHRPPLPTTPTFGRPPPKKKTPHWLYPAPINTFLLSSHHVPWKFIWKYALFINNFWQAESFKMTTCSARCSALGRACSADHVRPLKGRTRSAWPNVRSRPTFFPKHWVFDFLLNFWCNCLSVFGIHRVFMKYIRNVVVWAFIHGSLLTLKRA